jgi:hypothetical protein
LRAFIDDGAHGGQYVSVQVGSDGAPPLRIHLSDPVVSRGRTEEGGFAGYMPTGDSEYALADELHHGTPMYRLVREG